VDDNDLEPARWGQYEWRRDVAGETGAAVHEAFDLERERLVTVRTFRVGPLPPASGAVERFRAVVQAATGLQHPNIAGVLDGDWEGDVAYLVTETVDGEPLEEHLARVGKLPALQALALVAQLLSALDLAHRDGVVHGSIASGQVLVCRTGQLKLCGFGMAPLAAACAGDPGEVSDAAADLLAAAAVCFLALAGTPSGTASGAPGLPPAAVAVFGRALAQDPRDRFASAADLSNALRDAFEPPLWVRPDREALALVPAVPIAVAPARPAAVARPAHRQPRRAPGWRKRFALGAAALAGIAVVAALVVGGELEPSRGAVAATVPPPPATFVAMAPQPVEPAPAEPVAVEPAAPVAVYSAPALEPPVPAPAFVPAAPVEMPRQEPTPTRAWRGSAQPRNAAVDRPVARRAVAQLERTSQRTSPDFACRSQQMALAREVCRVAECATDEFRGHPVCRRMHAEQRARDQVAEQALRTR
jgi:hypothetical protein